MTERIAIIGGGKIGEALLAGLIRSGKQAKDLVVVEKLPARASELTDQYGVPTADVAAAVDRTQYVFLAIKPDDVDGVLREIAGTETRGVEDRVIVSLVAGLPLHRYETALPTGCPVIRVMPNTPMLVNEAMCAVAAGRFVGADQVAAVVQLLEAVGKVVVVPEKHMDAVTAISGSGPAYVFLMVEALIDAGVALGLPRVQAAELAVQTIRGAGVLLSESGTSPVDLRASVTSPGGTTAAAIRALEANGFRHGMYEATRACAAASAEAGRRPDVEGLADSNGSISDTKTP